MKNFNVRVYGLCINEVKEILLVNEEFAGRKFTKFPGGGLEMREGIKQCLIREFKEELNWDIKELKHFYTTDFYVKSAFDDSQIISVYYKIGQFDHALPSNNFYWKSLHSLSEEDVTFPIDKKVVSLLVEGLLGLK